MTTLGLRIDVDTFRGTRDGVPRLLELLAKHEVRATFYFTVGPDNMGRHLWRIFRPRFLAKMLRSNAPSLYGWGTLFAGTFWPGRVIGERLGAVIRQADAAGHEVGLHAWDHERWQRRALRMSVEDLHEELSRGMDSLSQLIGRQPDTSAAAGWICNERAVTAKSILGFRYNSDCRGRSVFLPEIEGIAHAPQVPTTLPTYDELVGTNGVTDRNYNDRLLGLLQPEGLNVLTIHAEVEGIARAALFDDFLTSCRARNIAVVPLGRLPQLPRATLRDRIVQAPVAGRDGNVCWQATALG